MCMITRQCVIYKNDCSLFLNFGVTSIWLVFSGVSHSLHISWTFWNIRMKLCRNVYNNGAMYPEQEPQLWLTYWIICPCINFLFTLTPQPFEINGMYIIKIISREYSTTIKGLSSMFRLSPLFQFVCLSFCKQSCSFCYCFMTFQRAYYAPLAKPLFILSEAYYRMLIILQNWYIFTTSLVLSWSISLGNIHQTMMGKHQRIQILQQNQARVTRTFSFHNTTW